MIRLFFLSMLPFVALAFAIGAAILWRRTRRFSALIQLIASSIIVLLLGVEELARYFDGSGRPEFWHTLRNPPIEAVGQIFIVLSFIAFPTAYIWYALTQKRI